MSWTTACCGTSSTLTEPRAATSSAALSSGAAPGVERVAHAGPLPRLLLLPPGHPGGPTHADDQARSPGHRSFFDQLVTAPPVVILLAAASARQPLVEACEGGQASQFAADGEVVAAE